MSVHFNFLLTCFSCVFQCNNFSRNSKFLASFAALMLVTVVALTIVSEIFLSSQGFEDRKESFACLVDYLDHKNVTDGYFDVAQSLDVSKYNCAATVETKRQGFYEDLKARLQRCSPIYEITFGECEVLNNPECTIEAVKNGTIKSCNNTELAKKFTARNGDLIKINELKENCEKMSTCFTCITEKLSSTSYEEIRFHSAAVNLTVIEFKVWKYFSILSRVENLESQGKELEKASKKRCKNERQCVDDSAYL